MKRNTELVEQSGTQRRHWASASFVLIADYAQINYRQRFADLTSSFQYRARQTSSALCHSKYASVHPQAKGIPS